MKIGLLLPRSDAHPGVGLDFMNGLKGFLKQQELNTQIQFFSENIGFGAVEKEVYEKAEKLLIIDDADILVAYIDEKVLTVLRPLLNASGKLMIVVNPGANYPLEWALQPNIINLTLQHAFLCWLTGASAGKVENANALMATTFYDCGYLHTAAMVKNFVKAGGNITFNYVNNQRYDDTFHVNELTGFLSANKDTNNLLCAFDDLPAALLYKQLNQFEHAERLHLFVSPMMLEQKALQNLQQGFRFSVRGYVPWLASMENEANKKFTDCYSRQTKRPAGIFSLLGWETGMLLEQIFVHSKASYADGAAIAQTLTKIKIDSPRGLLQLDTATHYYLSPAGKFVIKSGTSAMKPEWISDYENEWKAFVKEPTTGLASGWTNTYLCY